MWSRIRRFFRSVFGALVGMGEDPRLLLEQSVRDMRDKLPEMNAGIAKARAGVIRLENRSQELAAQVRSLQAKIKACLLAGDEALAGSLAVQLKGVQDQRARNDEQVAAGRQGYEALLKLKERYRVEMERKTEEAMAAIRQSEAAKWKVELAGAFQGFEVASVDSTHQEMIARLRGDSISAEGRLAMAIESVDSRVAAIEEKAQEIEGRELLAQFKLELGLQTAADDPTRKTVGIPEAVGPAAAAPYRNSAEPDGTVAGSRAEGQRTAAVTGG